MYSTYLFLNRYSQFILNFMGLAHGSGVANDVKGLVEHLNRDFEHGISFCIDRKILLAIHQHLVVVRAGPGNCEGRCSILNFKSRGAVNSSSS